MAEIQSVIGNKSVENLKTQKADQTFVKHVAPRIARMEKQVMKLKQKRVELYQVAESNDPYGIAMAKADKISEKIMKKIEDIEEWQSALDHAQSRLSANN